MIETHAPFAERAAKGARLFDIMEPFWYEKIDLARLDVSHPDNCIGGQFPMAWEILTDLADSKGEIPVDLAREHGMLLYDGEGTWHMDRAEGPDPYVVNYGTLTDAWRSEIERRRHPRPSNAHAITIPDDEILDGTRGHNPFAD